LLGAFQAWLERALPRQFGPERLLNMGSSELERVVQYIEDQEAHRRLLSFQDEYRRFLKQHEIEYDERYLWD
jgi:hypothetical protein